MLYNKSMINQQIKKGTKDNKLSIGSTFLIKIYINPHEQTQINMQMGSDVDMLIRQCIQKYKLKKQAHLYLKKQIMQQIQKIKSSPTEKQKQRQIQRCKTDYLENEKIFKESEQFANKKDKNQVRKKQNFLKDLKLGGIDKNRISIQRTPKNIDNLFFRRQLNIKASNNSNNNPKIYLKKKTQSQKQNIQNIPIDFKKKSSEKIKTHQHNQLLKNRSADRIKKQSASSVQKQKIQPIFLNFLDQTPSFSPTMPSKKLKTQSPIPSAFRAPTLAPAQKFHQLSLSDLEQQMQSQVLSLRYQKRIRSLQPQLCSLFHSMIRYNPPKINKIDPRYACFQDLNQKTIKGLHLFLVQLSDSQLGKLDFEGFKSMIGKYRADYLLDCLK